MLNGPHVVFAAGTTLGNLYPGLAIAREVEQRIANAQVTFVGDGRAVERHLVRGEGYNYVAMPGRPAPSGPLEAVRFVTDNVAGFWASRWMVREQQVSLVVGLGGSASSAMIRAAHGKGIPFLLLEQSADASRTTRRMAHAAQAVCGGFDAVRPHLPVDAPFALTGIPGRPAFESLYRSRATLRMKGVERPDEVRRLVVIGGPGEPSLNSAAPEALKGLAAELEGWQVVHQTGEGRLQETENRYRACGVDALAVTHLDELAPLMAETDLVVCRASGAMLAELALAERAGVLVPLADHDGGCQTANARIFSEATQCPVVEESTPASLADGIKQELRPLLADGSRRRELATAIGQQARPDAAGQIAEIASDVLCGVGARLAA